MILTHGWDDAVNSWGGPQVQKYLGGGWLASPPLTYPPLALPPPGTTGFGLFANHIQNRNSKSTWGGSGGHEYLGGGWLEQGQLGQDPPNN